MQNCQLLTLQIYLNRVRFHLYAWEWTKSNRTVLATHQKKDERIYVFYFKQYPMYEKIKNNGTNISPCSTKHINTPIHTRVTQNRPTGEENKTFTLSPIWLHIPIHKDTAIAISYIYSYMWTHRALVCRHFEALGIRFVFISIGETDAERKPNSRKHEQKIKAEVWRKYEVQMKEERKGERDTIQNEYASQRLGKGSQTINTCNSIHLYGFMYGRKWQTHSLRSHVILPISVTLIAFIQVLTVLFIRLIQCIMIVVLELKYSWFTHEHFNGVAFVWNETEIDDYFRCLSRLNRIATLQCQT